MRERNCEKPVLITIALNISQSLHRLSGMSAIRTLAFGLARNKTLIEAGREANAAAAFATTKLGAQVSLPHPQDIEATLARAA